MNFVLKNSRAKVSRKYSTLLRESLKEYSVNIEIDEFS